MGVTINTDSIDIALKQLAGKQKKIRNKALKVASEAFAKKLKENTPYYNDDTVHMRDDIKISKIDANGEIFIGYGKETAWRVHFVEIGTIKQKPQVFMQRTEREMKNTIKNIIEKEIKKGLGL